MAATCQDILRWGRIDPYFVWAEATGYAGMLRPEGHWIPVIAAGDAGSLEKLWAGMRESQDQPGRVYGVPAAKEAVFFTLLLGSDVRCAVLELLSRSGVRWELGLPVASPDAPLRADRPEEMPAEEPPAEFTGRAKSSDRQVIGFSGSVQLAAQPDTRYRCAGSVHASAGANIRSCSTKWSA